MQSVRRYFALPILTGVLHVVAVGPILFTVLLIAAGGFAGVMAKAPQARLLTFLIAFAPALLGLAILNLAELLTSWFTSSKTRGRADDGS
jgi:hypothetical protein